MKKILNNKNGYTLAELLVVMIITGILLGVGILAISQNSSKSNLKKSRILLAEYLRKVQNYSMTGYTESASVPNAYGIFFQDSDSYIFFQDTNDNNAYDSGEELKTVDLAERTYFDFSNFSPSSCDSTNGCTLISVVPKGSFCYDNDNSTKADTNCSADEVQIKLYIDDFSDTITINTFSGKVSY